MMNIRISTQVEIEPVVSNRYAVITKDKEKRLVGGIIYYVVAKQWFFNAEPGISLGIRPLLQIAVKLEQLSL